MTRVARSLLLATTVGALATALVSPATPAPASPFASPGIVFERSGDLFAIALDDGRTIRLTDTPVWDETDPAVSPDGRWIAYTRGVSIWIRSLDGRTVRRLTSGDDASPTWSPDGRRLYFSRFYYKGNFPSEEIYWKPVSGREPARRLTRPTHSCQLDPAVSPDGRRIAFTLDTGCGAGTTSYALRVVDRSGEPTGDLAALPNNDAADDGPFYGGASWAPDGTRIVFTRDYTLFVSSIEGTQLRAITGPRLHAGLPEWRGPAWSPNGQLLTFATHSGKDDLYVIHPDGTGLRRLTRTRTNESSPSWLPRMP